MVSGEYTALREELLQRFKTVFDSTRFGVLGIFALIAFQETIVSKFDAVTILVLLQTLIIVIGLYGLNEFQNIYRIGTHLKLVWETNDPTGWHATSRSFGSFLLSQEEGVPRLANRPFPFGYRWGGDSTNFGMVLLLLTFVSWAYSVHYRTENFLVPNSPLSVLLWIQFVLILWLIWRLVWGMNSSRERMEKNWALHLADRKNSAN